MGPLNNFPKHPAPWKLRAGVFLLATTPSWPFNQLAPVHTQISLWYIEPWYIARNWNKWTSGLKKVLFKTHERFESPRAPSFQEPHPHTYTHLGTPNQGTTMQILVKCRNILYWTQLIFTENNGSEEDQKNCKIPFPWSAANRGLPLLLGWKLRHITDACWAGYSLPPPAGSLKAWQCLKKVTVPCGVLGSVPDNTSQPGQMRASFQISDILGEVQILCLSAHLGSTLKQCMWD